MNLRVAMVYYKKKKSLVYMRVRAKYSTCACVCVLCGIKSQYSVMIILLLEDRCEAK